MASHQCACVHGISNHTYSQTSSHILDSCKNMVSHQCACVHGISNHTYSQTSARIQDNCRCMVSPLCVLVHGSLRRFLASVRPCHLKRLVLLLFLILIVAAVTFVKYSTNAKFSRAPGLGARPKRMWYYIVCSRLHTRPYLLDMWCGGKPGLTIYISLSQCLYQAAHQTISR